ncbi:MAG: response regulator [bacterium]|nr:response regulator [bacterium]
MKKTLFCIVLLITLSITTFSETPPDAKKLEERLGKVDGHERIPVLVQLATYYLERTPVKTTGYALEGLELLKKHQHSPILQQPQYRNLEVKLLNYVSKTKMREGNYPTALEYGLKARRLAEKNNDRAGYANALYNIAWVYNKEVKMSLALEHFTRAETLYKELGMQRKVARVMEGVSNLYILSGDFGTALEYLLKANKLYEKTNDDVGISKSLNNIGVIYNYMGNFDKALKNLLKARILYNKMDNEYALALACNNIGLIYYEQEKYADALREFNKSIKLKKKLGMRGGLAVTLDSIGFVLEKKNQLDKALGYYSRANKIFTEINNGQGIALSLKIIGRIHRKSGRYEKALHYLQKALDTAVKRGIKKEASFIYEELYKVYKLMENYRKALEYHKKYKKTNDSIFNETNSKRITRLANLHQMEEKEKEITLLKKNEEIQQLAFEKQTYLKNSFIAVAILVMGLAFVLYTRFRLKTIQGKEINRQKNEIEAQAEKLSTANIKLEKLSIVARETSNAVVIMDAEGNHLWTNEGFTRYYGLTLEQLIRNIGKNIIDTSNNPEIKQLLETCIKERKVIQYETCKRTATGESKYAQTTLTPVSDKNGNLSNLVAIDSDITKLKKTKEEIRKKSEELKKANTIARKEREMAQMADRSKSEFLARMSHEIRTPMNGVIGFAEMMLETPLTDEQKDCAETITRSGEALLALLNDILDFSKIEAGELTFDPIPFDPEITAFDVCEIVQPRLAGKDIELLCRIDNNIPAHVLSDPGRFRQVLINLVGNAVKFTDSGEIQLSLEIEKETPNEIILHTKVKDTGIGIPPGKIREIFEVFKQADGSVTRKYGGSGLGLSICKQIAKLMGGDIWVESQPGKGSTFHFTARVGKVEPNANNPDNNISANTANAANTTQTRKYFVGKKALLLDDNRNNLNILTHILETVKMELVPLSQPEEAADLVAQHASDGTPFDICIIDISMPVKSGYEVAGEIRQLGPAFAELPLLAFSSSTIQRSKRYKDAGFNGFLLKPVRKNKILTMIYYLLTNSPGNRMPTPCDGTAKPTQLVTKHSIFDQAKHSVRILLAEDNPIKKKLACFMLEKAGYHVHIVDDGEKAVKTYTAEPHNFELIFMDIQMPVKDGREAAKEIRQAGFNEIPIIAMTAEAMKGDREKCLEAGMNDYITKPLKRAAIYEMVKKWCLDKNQ